MKQERCAFEETIAAAGRSGQWNDKLLAHVADCRVCGEVALVSSYLCESSDAASASAELPDPGIIWSKLQTVRRAEAMERALRPILWARRCAFGVCGAAIVVAVVLTWSRIGGFFTSLVESWRTQPASPSAGHGSVLLIFTATFLLILFPVICGLYSAWSED